MKKDLNSYILTREELRIMDIIWNKEDATVREVCDAVARNKSSAYTTIQTHMQILERKGVLSRKKRGRSYVYRPVFSRKRATRNQVDDLLKRFFDGDPERLISAVLAGRFEGFGHKNAAMAKDSVIHEVRQPISHENMQ